MKADRTVLFLILSLCLAAAAGLQAQDPRGTDIRINQGVAGWQWQPDVATAADGRFVVVWYESDSSGFPLFVMARLFDAEGRARSRDIQVSRVTPGSWGGPAVAVSPDGGFVVVWAGGRQDPWVVLGRRFTADGRPLGLPFLLGRSTEHRQFEPEIAVAPDGGFIAVWTQEDGDSTPDSGATTDVFFRRFGADGRPLGPATMAIGGYEEQSGPRVAVKPGGSFVVVCQEWTGEGSFYDVLMQRFSRSGAPIGEPFTVNDNDPIGLKQYEPAVAVAADGRFAVAWTDDYINGVAARFFAADGTPLEPELAVSHFPSGRQEMPAVSALQTGGFLVLWASGGDRDGDGYGVFARVYSAAGKPLGREFRVNLNRSGSQLRPAVSVAPSGKGVATWYGPDGDSYGIFARRIAPPR